MAATFVSDVQALDEVREEVHLVGLDYNPFSLDRKTLGRMGEELALTYLESNGYELVTKNWSCPVGEIDLICLDENTLVFVEVKTRTTKHFEYRLCPELAVGKEKRRRYRALAKYYLAYHQNYEQLRFDVVAIEMMEGEGITLQHFISAFVADE